MSIERRGHWLQTVSGRQVWPADPRPGEIHIDDIAHALSMQCRFGGHVREHYSVAEHCVRASDAVRVAVVIDVMASDSDHVAQLRVLRLAALLHDAAEAYVVDVPRPVKHMISGYEELELGLEKAIADRFGLSAWMLRCREVKAADEQLLMTEKRDLLLPAPAAWTFAQGVVCEPLAERIVPWSQREAKRRFLARFDELTCPEWPSGPKESTP